MSERPWIQSSYTCSNIYGAKISAKMSLAEMQGAKMLSAEILGAELSSSSKIKG